MNDVLVEFLTNAVINSIAFRKGERTHMHAPAVSFWKDKGFITEVVPADPLTFTREDAEKLVTTNFPSETPTYATPMRAYDGDLDPAWVVLTSSMNQITPGCLQSNHCPTIQPAKFRASSALN